MSYWRLLILDGHGSHITGEFIYEALVNQVLLVYLLPHTSHLCQPCDLGPFAQLKAYYSKHLKSFILTGETRVTRAQFNTLYRSARIYGLSERYTLAGWKRSGLWPFQPSKVLDRSEIALYRSTTPNLAPPRTPYPAITLTPQNKPSYKEIQSILMQGKSREDKRLIIAMEHAYDRESTARQLLEITVSTARKRQREEEQQDITKRLKKQDAAVTINFTDIAKTRNHPTEEVEALLAAMPDRTLIYRMAETPDT
jgi:hypothetical protein